MDVGTGVGAVVGKVEGVGLRVGDLVAVGVGVSGRAVEAAAVGIGVTVAGGGDATVPVGESPEQDAATAASNTSRLAMKNIRKCLVSGKGWITNNLYEITTGSGSPGPGRTEYSTAYAK